MAGNHINELSKKTILIDDIAKNLNDCEQVGMFDMWQSKVSDYNPRSSSYNQTN